MEATAFILKKKGFNMCGCSHGCEAEVVITCGDDYLKLDGLALCFTQACGEKWPLAVAPVTLTISGAGCSCAGASLTIDGTYAAGTPAKACFDITKAQTMTLAPAKRGYNYTVKGVLPTGGTHTFARGVLTVLP